MQVRCKLGAPVAPSGAPGAGGPGRRRSLAARIAASVTLVFLGFSVLAGFWVAVAVRGIYRAEAVARVEVMAKAALASLDREWGRTAFAVTNPVVQRRFAPLLGGANVDAVTRALRELRDSSRATFIHAYRADQTFLTSSEEVRSVFEPPFLSALAADLAKRTGRFVYVSLPQEVLEYEGVAKAGGGPSTVLAVAAVLPLKDDFGDAVGTFLLVRVLTGDHGFAAELGRALGGEISFVLGGAATATSVVDAAGKPAVGLRVPAENHGDALLHLGSEALQGHYHQLGEGRSVEAGLWAAIPVSGLLDKAQALTLRIQAAGVAAAVLFGFLILLVARRSLRHVPPLLAHMEGVSRGHLRRVPPAAAGDEIGALTAGLDATVASLRDLVAQVKSSFGRVEGVNAELVQASDALAAGNAREAEALAALEGTAGALAEVVASVRAEVSSSTDSVRQNFATLQAQLGSLEAVAEDAGSVLEAADQTRSALSDMSEGQAEISKSLGGLAERLAESAAAMEEIDQAVGQVRDLTASARDLSAGLATEATERGRGAMERVGTELQRTGGAIATLVRSVESLGQRSQEIGSIIDIISGVASQSKLLALNASILAAQAGERGRPFSVVAENMRALSESTTSSARTVAGLIEGMQQESRRAVAETAQGVASLERSNEEVARLRSALESIVAGAGETSSLVERIAALAELQSAASSRVVSSLAWVASTSQQISAVMAQHTEAGRHILSLAQDTRHRATGMKDLADGQAEELESMTHSLEAAARGAERLLASAGSTEASAATLGEAVAVIRRVAEDGRGQVAAVKASVSHLASEADRVSESLSAFVLD